MVCKVLDVYIVIFSIFFFNDTATTEIYTLSLHDALPIFRALGERPGDDIVYPRQKIFTHRRGPRGIFCEALDEAFLPGKGRLPGEHLEQHATETVRIASPIELFVAHQLLGAHVRG